MYETIITPTLERCRACGEGSDALELTEEKREVWLDAQGNVNEQDTRKNDPVTADLILAVVKNRGTTEKRIVHRRFEGAKRCPKYL